MITPAHRHVHDLWMPQGGMANCYEAGANACHIKPLRYTEHLGVLLDLFY
jgi:hypothetical protein